MAFPHAPDTGCRDQLPTAAALKYG